MPWNRFCAAIALLLFALPAGGQQAPFTLEQVFSAPFPDQLTSSPDGTLAWVLDARGVRNVWVASPPEYQGRQATAFSADDGQEISDLSLTPDGRTLVFVRGGAPNRRGEIPNPLSAPDGVERAIWTLATGGGIPRRIGEGAAPVLSPKGDSLAFIKAGQIWIGTLDGKEPPRQLVHARGGSGSLQWAPDGNRLAFVSSRERHSFIGVYDLAAKRLSWLDPSLDQDRAPSWSPDGTQIAYIRIPASLNDVIFTPERQGEPWSIRVADAASGKGRRIWRADPGRGSVFHPAVAESQLFWVRNGRLVFPWEKDGWLHLYGVSSSGGTASLLTPGEFEVEHVSLLPGGTGLAFSSNQDDIDRRHLWRVSSEGGAPRALTRGEGIEWSPVPAGAMGRIAFLRSDARTPAHPALLDSDGGVRELAPGSTPPDFPSGRLIAPQQVIFPAADGMMIHGQLFLPPASGTGGKLPALVFFHGGSRRQMLLGFHYMYYYHNTYAMNQYFAAQGYIVLSVNYRSGIGYGMEFREALNYGAAGASEFNDVMGAGLYLKSRPDVDGRRIGLWGGSYGGYLTAMGLARASDLFSAGVDLHGVHDWNYVIRNFVDRYDPLRLPEVARLAFQSSPISSVETWRSPVLLIHGDDDRNVPFTESVSLAVELRKRGVEFEELVFPDEVHDFLVHAHWLDAYRAAADFFERKLRAK